MPEYLYQHPDTEETKSIIQSIHDKHEYIDEQGIKWNRVYTVPQMGIDTKMNASTSEREFSEKTISLKLGL